MKRSLDRVLLIVSLFIVACIIGCYAWRVSKDGLEKEYDRVYIDKTATVYNNCPVKNNCGIKKITIRVINPTYIDQHIKVECRFKDGELFGKIAKTISPRDDKRFVISGFSRYSVGKTTCKIVEQ